MSGGQWLGVGWAPWRGGGGGVHVRCTHGTARRGVCGATCCSALQEPRWGLVPRPPTCFLGGRGLPRGGVCSEAGSLQPPVSAGVGGGVRTVCAPFPAGHPAAFRRVTGCLEAAGRSQKAAGPSGRHRCQLRARVRAARRAQKVSPGTNLGGIDFVKNRGKGGLTLLGPTGVPPATSSNGATLPLGWPSAWAVVLVVQVV